jgi:hypothetical protein
VPAQPLLTGLEFRNSESAKLPIRADLCTGGHRILTAPITSP